MEIFLMKMKEAMNKDQQEIEKNRRKTTETYLTLLKPQNVCI